MRSQRKRAKRHDETFSVEEMDLFIEKQMVFNPTQRIRLATIYSRWVYKLLASVSNPMDQNASVPEMSLEPELEEIAGDLNAKQRRSMAAKLERWAAQLRGSVKFMHVMDPAPVVIAADCITLPESVSRVN
jgi:hypothetical protein